MRNYKTNANGNPTSVQDRLIFLRNEKGLTATEVANVFNVNKSTVSRWESEKYWVDIDTPNKHLLLLQLVELYQADYDWVLTGNTLKQTHINNIMIIDDDATSLAIMTLIIKSVLSVKYQLYSFSVPDKALSWAKNNPSNIVFCDYKMPKMYGDIFLKKLRMLPAYKTTPVIAITQVREPGIMNALLKAGATHVLQKPINEQKLTELLKQNKYT